MGAWGLRLFGVTGPVGAWVGGDNDGRRGKPGLLLCQRLPVLGSSGWAGRPTETEAAEAEREIPMDGVESVSRRPQ